MGRLFDRKPAEKWNEAYPIGNGRLGAMIFGQTGYERIQLNEDSVWYGQPMDRINPEAKQHMPEIRELIRTGKIQEAEKLMKRTLSGIPQSQRPYETAGDLWIDWEQTVDDSNGYERELDLNHAVACSTAFGKHGKTVRTYFASAPDQVAVIHAEAPENGQLSCSALLSRSRFYETVEKISDDTIMMHVSCGEGGVHLVVAVKAVASGGSVHVVGEHLCVEHAEEVTFYMTAETTFYCGEEGSLPEYTADPDREVLTVMKETLAQQKTQNMHIKRALKRVNAAAEKGYAKVLEDHITDYRQLFDRVNFRLSGNDMEKLEYTKTYFDYGRYLLISSSRPGTLPANLQGIWNEEIAPSWDSKFTININTEMNYWPAEVCDLPECHQPLFDLLKRLRYRGTETAQRMYGCRGFLAHHNTDIWADCAPQDIYIPATYWVLGAAWLCTHIWKHYTHTGDQEYLKDMYPIIQEASVFFHDFLMEEDGVLVTSPSTSPENTYIMKDGTSGCVCSGPSMDTQILRDLLGMYDNASKVLGIEDDDVKYNREVLCKLPKEKIGQYGQLMEWREDYEEQEPGHRHISHLYALHPSDQITVDDSPELAKAASRTLERRLSFGGGHTGWSCAWIVNLYARLWDGNAAWENLKKLYEKSTFPNMMDNHPMLDYFVFQIDGNFGATAAITEMIVQSNANRTVLLPALPDDWKEGTMEGLVLYGGAKADIYWKDGQLESCSIYARHDFSDKLCYKNSTQNIELAAGERCMLKLADGVFVVSK